LRNPTKWRRPRRRKTGIEIWLWMALPRNILIGTAMRVAPLIIRFLTQFFEDHALLCTTLAAATRCPPRIPLNKNTR